MMEERHYFKFSNAVLVAPILAVLIIWTVFWLELHFGVNLNTLGVYPRTASGLKGVFFGPLIHGSLSHLYHNTIPLAVLTASLFYFYHRVALRVLLLGILLSGVFVWAVGRPSYHIGASGIIYLLASFVFFKGIFSKYYRLVALSLMVVFIYGSMLWYLFPLKEGISWEGHLGGFLAGLVLALFIKTNLPVPKKYAWQEEGFNAEEDEFLRHFDADGNFVPANALQEDEPPEVVTFKYEYKKDYQKDPNSD